MPPPGVRPWQGRWSGRPMWPELFSTNLGFACRAANNRAAGGATGSHILAQVRAIAPPTNANSALFVIDSGHQDFVPFINSTDDLALYDNYASTIGYLTEII